MWEGQRLFAVMCNVKTQMNVNEFHLVAQGLRATPLQKNLLDAAGAGHPKTLRALQFGFGVHRQRPTVVDRTLLVYCCLLNLDFHVL